MVSHRFGWRFTSRHSLFYRRRHHPAMYAASSRRVNSIFIFTVRRVRCGSVRLVNHRFKIENVIEKPNNGNYRISRRAHVLTMPICLRHRNMVPNCFRFRSGQHITDHRLALLLRNILVEIRLCFNDEKKARLPGDNQCLNIEPLPDS